MSKINESELTKLYYSIGEVAKMFDVNASLIRFWEKEFPTVSPKKNKKGNRLFTPKEIAKIDRIYTLVKENGYTLEGAKKALKQKAEPANITNQGDQELNHSELLNRLEKIKSRLISLKN